MKKNYTLALVFILIGIMIFFGVAGIDLHVRFWHAILFIVGIGLMLSEKRITFFSGALTLVGAYLMLFDLQQDAILNFGVEFPRLDWGYLIAIGFVAGGLSLLFRKESKIIQTNTSSEPHPGNATVLQDGNRIDVTAIFSGTQMDYAGEGYTGGTITTIFGGADVDLTRIVPSTNDLYIDVTAIFGGADIIIPHDWQFERSGATALFGGIDAKRYDSAAGPVTLHLRGLILFGGVDIKRK